MAGELIGREALDRILKRAAELQAGEHDVGEGLTRAELLRLGDDVGIPAQYLRQAMLEEQTRALPEAAGGLWGALAGPARVAASRVVQGDPATIERALARWMEGEELLQVKRRFPDRVTWEPKSGFFASMQRGLKMTGRAYALAEAVEVAGQVTPLEKGFCHVQLVADVRNLRRQRAAGAIVLATMGALATLVALSIGLPTEAAQLAALVPAAAGGLGGWAVARTHRRVSARVEVGLEQVLDRLERGEIKAEHTLPGPRSSPFARIADEIKKTLEL
jgi:hypothetical protein